MAAKKTISAREVVADIRVGMTDEQLMLKHQLSGKGLQSLFAKLVSAGLLTQAELDQRSSSFEQTVELAPDIVDAQPDPAETSPATSTASMESEPKESSWGQDDKIMASCLFAALTTGIAFAQAATKSWFWFIIWIPVSVIAAFVGYHAFLDKYKDKMKYVVIAGAFFLLALIGNIGGSKPTLTTFDDALATYDPQDGSPYMVNPPSKPDKSALLLFTGETEALIRDDILLVNDTTDRGGEPRHWAVKTAKATVYKPREGERIAVIGRIVDTLKAESEHGTAVSVLLVDPVVMANGPDSLIPLTR